jgi:hypothetical protein
LTRDEKPPSQESTGLLPACSRQYLDHYIAETGAQTFEFIGAFIMDGIKDEPRH